MDDLSDVPCSISGTPLAEVFSVIIHTASDNICKIYGRVQVEDGHGTICFYDVETLESEEYESIEQSGSITLTNSDRAISATDTFTVNLDLKYKNGDIVEFIKGSFSWDPRKNNNYDCYLVEKVEGSIGFAMVYYTVHSTASEAIIVLPFEAEDDGCTKDIYGHLTVTYGKRFDRAADENLRNNSRMNLIDRSKDEPTEIEDGYYLIPARSIVTVPSYSSLLVNVKFGCVLPTGDHEESVWSGELEFSPWSGYPGLEDTLEIQGKYGVVKVKVTWLTYYVESWEKLERIKKDIFNED